MMRFKGSYSFLSNFSPCEILMDGLVYPSVEHAYQAAKFREDDMLRLKIQRTALAGEAKRLGRTKPCAFGKHWDSIKVQVMKDLLKKKFKAGTPLAKSLKATGDIELVEDNYWGDTFWGVCDGAGQNMLGKLLMEIRSKL